MMKNVGATSRRNDNPHDDDDMDSNQLNDNDHDEHDTLTDEQFDLVYSLILFLR